MQKFYSWLLILHNFIQSVFAVFAEKKKAEIQKILKRKKKSLNFLAQTKFKKSESNYAITVTFL